MTVFKPSPPPSVLQQKPQPEPSYELNTNKEKTSSSIIWVCLRNIWWNIVQRIHQIEKLREIQVALKNYFKIGYYLVYRPRRNQHWCDVQILFQKCWSTLKDFWTNKAKMKMNLKIIIFKLCTCDHCFWFSKIQFLFLVMPYYRIKLKFLMFMNLCWRAIFYVKFICTRIVKLASERNWHSLLDL